MHRHRRSVRERSSAFLGPADDSATGATARHFGGLAPLLRWAALLGKRVDAKPAPRTLASPPPATNGYQETPDGQHGLHIDDTTPEPTSPRTHLSPDPADPLQPAPAPTVRPASSSAARPRLSRGARRSWPTASRRVNE